LGKTKTENTEHNYPAAHVRWELVLHLPDQPIQSKNSQCASGVLSKRIFLKNVRPHLMQRNFGFLRQILSNVERRMRLTSLDLQPGHSI
jgi:hypothetical protein